MRIEFTNGATVHELWGKLPDGTLIAAFQYFAEARACAEQLIERKAPEVSLLVIDHGTGETRHIFHATAPALSDGA